MSKRPLVGLLEHRAFDQFLLPVVVAADLLQQQMDRRLPKLSATKHTRAQNAHRKMPEIRVLFQLLKSDNVFSAERVDHVHRLTQQRAERSNDSDSRLFKSMYQRRWWSIWSIAIQRAIASDVLGSDWAPLYNIVGPSEKKLLRCVVFVPRLTRAACGKGAVGCRPGSSRM